MSKSSVTAAGRSVKSARRNGQKKAAAKVARTATKKSPARRPTKARTSRHLAPTNSVQAIIRTVSPPVQPIELPVKSHKYIVGDTVYFNSPSFGRAAATGSYTIVKLLPSEGDDYQYRIKSTGEAFERVAKESQLDRA